MPMRSIAARARYLFAGWIVVATPICGAVEPTLQDLASALPAQPSIVIYQAREIVTLDPAKPTARAVAVVGDRILATGSVEELKVAAGTQPYTVSTVFADQVIVPGFIAQHDHPLLAAFTMTSEIIAIEDWVLSAGVRPAAKSRSDYLKKLAAANARMKDPDELLLTWGYHQYFHGSLVKADLDAISATRPIIVWHRSAHEFFVNSAAEKDVRHHAGLVRQTARQREEAVGLRQRALLGAGLVRGAAADGRRRSPLPNVCARVSSSSATTTTPMASHSAASPADLGEEGAGRAERRAERLDVAVPLLLHRRRQVDHRRLPGRQGRRGNREAARLGPGEDRLSAQAGEALR